MAIATERAERFDAMKRVLVGRPRATGEMDETLLSKKLALPVFASDPLSSVAYATESGLVVLVAASVAAAHFILPISIAIGVLLAIVVLSYRQTVQAYQTSGGAYVVAKENLGTLPSLVGAAALLVDYILTVGVFVLVRAFASGAVALTGVEAISNGVSAFQPPKGRNAAGTLGALGVIAISLFLGVSYLAVHMHARPSQTVSLVSEIARATFPASSPTSFLYYAVQALTFAILVLAANTSYQGFPRLAAVLAQDRFFPRQFVNLGDRLVYSNGIVVLAGLASLLIWVFHANVISLIHLYVVGVFTAFTLSQAGMVRYWRRRREPEWQRRVAVNGVGAVTTGLVTLLVIQAKFLAGAWMVTVAVPALIGLFFLVNRHYGKVGRRLRAGVAAVAAAPPATNQVVLYVEAADAALREALWYAHEIAGDGFRAIHVPGRHTDPGIRPRFRELTDLRCDLEVVEAAGSRVDAVIDYLWALPRGESTFVTMIVPEQFKRRSLAAALARRPDFALKLRLLTEPGVVVTDVPVLARRMKEWRAPKRAVCRILVSGAHAASMRTVNYANTLGLEDRRAVFFAFDADEAGSVEREWSERRMQIPLEIEEAPFRDLGDPLLRYLRGVTADPDAVAVVLMPELVFGGTARLLHNQRALYIKRLLLFEPRVILASVPYRLD